MNFAEKVKNLRKKKGWTQRELGDKLGLTMRTIGSYESGRSYPKSRSIYRDMAKLFSVDINYLRVEEEEYKEEFLINEGSESKENDQVQNLIKEVALMFAGGRLSEEDKDAVMRALQDAYWDAKKEKR